MKKRRVKKLRCGYTHCVEIPCDSFDFHKARLIRDICSKYGKMRFYQKQFVVQIRSSKPICMMLVMAMDNVAAYEFVVVDKM